VRILTVAGTRPELIKLAPLVPLLDERFEHRYLFTGQHYSKQMVDGLLSGLPVRRPDHSLEVGCSTRDTLRSAIDVAVADFAPDLVLVYGDTNSTLAAAQSAYAAGIRLIHLEAGVRSFDLSMVEERNRVEIDRLADLRLAPTPLCQWFLTHLEGYPRGGCPAVGNLGVDAWMMYGVGPAGSEEQASPTVPTGDFALLTLHRPDTVDRIEIFSALLAEVGRLSLRVLFPVHPRTRKQLDRVDLPSNVELLEPLAYRSFCSLLRQATVVLSDSGGVQEEAATAGTPCVTLRPNTDRPESVLLGMNRLYPPSCGGDLGAVVDAACRDRALPHHPSPYGDGRAAMRITSILESLAGREPSVAVDACLGLAGPEQLLESAEFILSSVAHRGLRIVG